MIRIDHYIHTDGPPPAWATEIKAAIERLTERTDIMANRFDDLAAQVASVSTVSASVLALLEGQVAELAALKVSDAADQAKIDALKDDLVAAVAPLAAAVTAGTPAEPDAPPA